MGVGCVSPETGGNAAGGGGGDDGAGATATGTTGGSGGGGASGSTGTTGPACTLTEGDGAGDPGVWSSNLPIVVIDTMGQEIPDEPRIVAHMGIIDRCAGRNRITDPFDGYDGRINIEIRGSTSQQYPKKSYGFETQNDIGGNLDAALLGHPPENDWVLYAPYTDKALFRNVLAYALWAELGHYSPRTRFCEVFIDGDYRGVYVLTEKIKRDEHRVDVTPLLPTDTMGDAVTGGYLIKIDKLTGAGMETWRSEYDNRVLFQAHDPRDAELVQPQKDYIETLTAALEDTLAGPSFADPAAGYRALIDVPSFVDFFIVEEVGRAVDGYRSSTFLYKDRNSVGGLLTMGPVWDYDIAFGNADYCDGWLTTGWQHDFNAVCPMFESQVPFWWGRLLEDPAFTRELRCRFDELRGGPLSDASMLGFIDAQVVLLAEAQQRNFERWPILGEYVEWNKEVFDTWEEEVAYVRTWLLDRLAWLDANVPGVCM